MLHQGEGVNIGGQEEGAEQGPASLQRSALWPAEGATGPCQNTKESEPPLWEPQLRGSVTLSFRGTGSPANIPAGPTRLT